MNDRILNRRNLIFLLLLVASCVAGGRSVISFWWLLIGYHAADAITSAYRASEMYMMFLMFIAGLTACIVFSFLAKKKVDRQLFITRNIIIIASLMLANISFANITILSTVVLSRYMEDAQMLEYAVSSRLTVSAVASPHLYYAYMAAEALMIVIAVISVTRYFKDRRKEQKENNLYM